MSDEMPSYEECFICDDLTGRAGQGEDSLYCDECDKGPYCPECFKKHHESDVKVAKLEADLEERAKQFHLAKAKVMSREAIIEQLSETELAKDVTRLEGVLEKIKRAAMLYLEHGEPELADELEALLKEAD